MNDFFTRSFINFNKFDYDKSINRIDPKDIIQMNSIYKKTILISFLMPATAFILFRTKSKIFSFGIKKLEENGNSFQNYFNIKDLTKNYEDKTSLDKIKSKTDEYKFNQLMEENNFSEKVKIESPSRKIFRKAIADKMDKSELNEFKDRVINHSNAWYNMKDVSFINKMNESNLNSIKKSTKFNQFFINDGIKYLLKFIKTTILLLPFMVILFKIWFDFIYFNLSMYFKYKPLVDAYYKQKIIQSEKH